MGIAAHRFLRAWLVLPRHILLNRLFGIGIIPLNRTFRTRRVVLNGLFGIDVIPLNRLCGTRCVLLHGLIRTGRVLAHRLIGTGRIMLNRLFVADVVTLDRLVRAMSALLRVLIALRISRLSWRLLTGVILVRLLVMPRHVLLPGFVGTVLVLVVRRCSVSPSPSCARPSSTSAVCAT